MGQLSVKSIHEFVEIQKSFSDDPSDISWSCSTMSGQVLYVDMNVSINAKQFSMRLIISWAWQMMVGL